MTLRQSLHRSLRAAPLAALVGAAALAPAQGAEVNLYSLRQPELIDPILAAFTRNTGIKVNVVFAEQGVLERLRAEGANAQADAVLTVDIGTIQDMVEADVLQPVSSPVLAANIPAAYRHPDGLWYGLTTRARLLLVSKDRVQPGAIRSYEDLAKPEWKGRICTRSGKHQYNVSLLASMIAHKGEAEAKRWIGAVRDNLARKPQGNDRGQAKAIVEGVCDVAITNTYYLALMATNEKQPEEKAWAAAVRPVFANADDRGTHVNISGAAVTKGAKNRAEAVRLLEYLSGDAAQQLYATKNYEYPVKPGVALDPLVASWGTLKADALSLAEIVKLRARATRMMDEVNYDQGPGA